MGAETDARYYALRAPQELGMVTLAIAPNVKALHLDMAEEYAALREQTDLEITDARRDTCE